VEGTPDLVFQWTPLFREFRVKVRQFSTPFDHGSTQGSESLLLKPISDEICVESLDLAHLYGAPPRVRSQEITLPHLHEDEAYYSGAPDEVIVEDVDR